MPFRTAKYKGDILNTAKQRNLSLYFIKWRFSLPIHSPASSADHKAPPTLTLMLWDVMVIYSPAHRGEDPQCGHMKQKLDNCLASPCTLWCAKGPSMSGQEVTGSGVNRNGTASSGEPPSATPEAHIHEIFTGSGFIWGHLAKCHSNPPTLSSRNFFSLLTVQTLFPLSAQQEGRAALPT